MAVGVVNIALLYRRIDSIGKLTVTLWVGTLLTTLAVIVTGAFHFDAGLAFDFPPGAFDFSLASCFGLGAASRVGIYDYLGYYDICYIGDEVQEPGPRHPAVDHHQRHRRGADLHRDQPVDHRRRALARVRARDARTRSRTSSSRSSWSGSTAPAVATVFTLLVLWTAFGSVFALLLGYSRIPYAAAIDGNFFRVFGRLHPTKHFPHVSLLVIGAIAIVVQLRCPSAWSSTR